MQTLILWVVVGVLAVVVVFDKETDVKAFFQDSSDVVEQLSEEKTEEKTQPVASLALPEKFHNEKPIENKEPVLINNMEKEPSVDEVLFSVDRTPVPSSSEVQGFDLTENTLIESESKQDVTYAEILETSRNAASTLDRVSELFDE